MKEREICPNAPVVLMAIQVRHPSSEQFGPRQVAEVSTHINNLLPLRSGMWDFSVDPQPKQESVLSQEGDGSSFPRWTSRDKRISLSIRRDSIVIETTDYGSYDRMRKLLEKVLQIYQATGLPVGPERIGLREEWRKTTAERGRASVSSMLVDLADLGFAWRDIARMVGVSVPAVQKWRKGEKASGASRNRIASLLAACDLITKHYLVDDIASWFEMPLSTSAPITPIVLFSANRPELVFEFASGHVDPEDLLTEFDPEWRERYRSDFEVFEASDGNRSIRLKD